MFKYNGGNVRQVRGLCGKKVVIIKLMPDDMFREERKEYEKKTFIIASDGWLIMRDGTRRYFLPGVTMKLKEKKK